MNLEAAQVRIVCHSESTTTRNLLTKTEKFDDGAWGTWQTTISANAAIAPDGMLTADKLVEAAGVPGHYVWRSLAGVAGGIYTFSIFVKAAGRNSCAVEMYSDEATDKDVRLVFDLESGVLLSTTTAGSPDYAYTVESHGGGWWRFSISFTVSAGATLYFYTYSMDGTAASFEGDTSKGVDLWGAQLELGAQATAYQAVDAAPSGYDLNYAQAFDMLDNSMITDWRHYFVDPITYKGDLIVEDLPPILGLQTTIVATMPGGTVRIGAVFPGLSEDLGMTLVGASASGRDHSRKEFDEFAGYSFTERGFARTMQLQVALEDAQYDAVMARFRERRAQPSLWIGTGKYANMWVHGIWRDHRGEVPNYGLPVLAAEFEGIAG